MDQTASTPLYYIIYIFILLYTKSAVESKHAH